MIFRYSALGLDVTVPFACAGFAPATQPATGRSVAIEQGSVPEALDLPICVRPLLQIDAGGTALFHAPGIARYRIADGNCITIEVLPGASRDRAVDLLKGTPLALLCLQRGLVPIDAVCVAREGQALLLAGPAACGKSTLAGALADHGFRLMADGLCVLEAPDGAPPRIWPGFPELRLWPDSAEALRLQVEGGALSPGGRHVLSGEDWFEPAPQPLAGMVTLHPAVGGIAEHVERHRGFTAFEKMMNVLRLPEVSMALGLRAKGTQVAARAAAAAQTWEMWYPRGLARIDALALWVLRHFDSAPTAASVSGERE